MLKTFLTVKRVLERLIIGMRTAGWSTPCCWPGGSFGGAVRNCWEQWTARRYPRAENRVWSDQEYHEERERIEGSCGKHRTYSDSFSTKDTSRWAISSKIMLVRPYTKQSFTQDFLRHFQILPWPPALICPEHVWDQLKRQMPSFTHSVHDLELAVQNL
ncbi:hypothetical protein TNCV_4956651 [Trichonephila clavipes]|nr:hypothetical protein TNCV_4956651 [Trichonephila clavipes]